ncbi:hypothetical protein DFH27DRAFT_535021 [Peziza echinospora]|nr:hypothetical protein DFH27DRAFT_535021 [Peziza echinospora]
MKYILIHQSTTYVAHAQTNENRYLESEFFKIVIENPIDSGDGINHGLQTAPTSTSSTSPSPSASISSLPASSSTSSRSTSTSKSEQHEPQDPPTADAPPIPDAFEALAAELARVKVSPGSLGSYKPRIKTLKTLKTPKPAGASTGAEASSAAAPAMYVHRELLASLSPELERHTVSGMKEGGGMVMHGVDLPTLRRFLQWAYTQEYSMSVSS